MTRGVFTAASSITATGHNAVWDPPRCRLTNSANISITTSGTAQALTFDTETYDVNSMHSTSVNTSRITVPSDGAGTYHITASVRFANNATGFREIQFRINGTTTIAASRSTVNHATDDTRITLSTDYQLAVGDYIELMVTQTSGGALNVIAASAYSPIFTARWVSI